MKVWLAPLAEQDLIGGALYHARSANALLGNAFISEFERSSELLGQYPLLGAPWRGAIRRHPLRRFPYSIVHELLDSEVRILAVAHQRRKPGFWKGRA